MHLLDVLLDVVVGGAVLLFVVALMCLTHLSLFFRRPKENDEQNELVDAIAERTQLLGGVSIAMAPDLAEMTLIPRPPKRREEVPVQISRLLQAMKSSSRNHERWRASQRKAATTHPTI